MKKGSSILLGLTAAALVAAPVDAQSYYRADAEASMAGFGMAVEIFDGMVLVGEPDNQIRPGTVYMYGRDGMSWTEMGTLRAADGGSGDGFGVAIAASGDHLMITSQSAGVHHFHRVNGEYREMGTLPMPEGVTGDMGFGVSLAISGDWLIVGVPGMSNGQGAAYLYHAGANGWQQVGMTQASTPEDGSVFGLSVALEGDLAVVGEPGRNSRQGAIHVFRVGMDGFGEGRMIEADGVQNNAQFGSVVWTNGGSIAASAPAADGARGTVRLFHEDEGEWEEAGRLAAFDPQARSGFGSAIAYNGQSMMVGSPGTNTVYRFDMDGMAITSAQKVRSEELSGRAGFGAAIAATAEVIAIAAPNADRGAGTVAIMDAAGTTEMTLVMSPPEGFDPVTGEEVRCEGGVAVEWDCSEVDLVSFVPVSVLGGDDSRGIVTNDNWGWTDPETGKEYALVGMTDRASFVDISDPLNPVVVGILPMTEGANGSSWRDLKTYQNHVYIVSDGAGQHGMQVFDLTRLRDFAGGAPIVFDEDALYTEISSAHNIVINEESGFAYSVGSSSGGESCGGGLHMIDIRDPKNPTFAGCFADPQTGRASTGYSHDAQCVNYVGPDPDYQGREICLGSNETMLSIADVTDKDAPVAISRAAYPNPGYTHQGWLTDDHRFFFMNDELDELNGIVDRTRTIVWDLTDLDDPQLVVEHLGTQASSDHNLYIQGNLMYQSNYQSGLRILDISDPANPTEVAYFDTVPYGDNGAGFGGSWSNYPYFESGIVIVTSGSEGLFMVRPTVRRTVF